MPDTVVINLARALKLKNRLAGRVNKFDQDIKTYNSSQEGAERPDVKALYARRAEVVRQLIDLKTALNAANQSVQRTIYELAECKALIALLAGLNTRHGKVIEGYPGTEIHYVAQLRKEEVDREVHRLERETDRLQELLDDFNHRTTITVAAALLEDGEEEVR
jgi:hypothetical protein